MGKQRSGDRKRERKGAGERRIGRGTRGWERGREGGRERESDREREGGRVRERESHGRDGS